MADVKVEFVSVESAPDRQGVETRMPAAVWMLALVMTVTTILAVAKLADESRTPVPRQVRVPVPVAVDVSAAEAMKDESAAAVAVARGARIAALGAAAAKVGVRPLTGQRASGS